MKCVCRIIWDIRHKSSLLMPRLMHPYRRLYLYLKRLPKWMSSMKRAKDDRLIASYQPLATRMRPTALDEFIGQSHLLGAGKPLRRAIEQGILHSMILWGPPGTGKTTLAQLMADKTHARFERLSA